MLVPTVRHADQFRRRLVAQCGAAFALRVVTVVQLSRDIGDTAGLRAVTHDVAKALLEQTLRRVVVSGPASYLEPIARMAGLLDLLDEAVTELLGGGVDSDRLLAAANRSGHPKLQSLAAVYDAYLSELAMRRWVHPARLPAAAARVNLEEHTAPLVIVDGFQFLNAVELDLLKAIARGADDLLISLDPESSVRTEHMLDRLNETFRKHKTVERASGKSTAAATVRETVDNDGELS